MDSRVTGLCVCLLLAGPLSIAPGERIGPAAASAQGERPVKPPPVNFDLGLDIRLREETLHNVCDFDDDAILPGDSTKTSDAQYFRIRPRVCGSVRLRNGLALSARFTSEVRKYVDPYESPAKTQIILDNLYLDVPTSVGLPFSLRVGRQDLTRGEGFILMDGGPLDGSRSTYQNAVLLTLDGAQIGVPLTKLDLLAIRNLAWDPFVVANGPTDAEKARGRGKIVENDETAFGLYATSTSLRPHAVETYYLYKEEEPPAAKCPSLKIHTTGLRLSGFLPYEINYAFEAAGQFGTRQDADGEYDHRSYGGYFWAQRQIPFLLLPGLKAGVIYLSGDDRKDFDDPDRVEHAWYPVFARWPKWSELYLYTYMTENRVGEWGNLAALQAELSLRFSAGVTLTYDYYYMRALESLASESAIPEAPAFFGTGKVRGHNHQWKLEAALSQHVSWHFWIERFAPGDFYACPKDDAFFIRWQIMLMTPWL